MRDDAPKDIALRRSLHRLEQQMDAVPVVSHPALRADPTSRPLLLAVVAGVIVVSAWLANAAAVALGVV
jgi:hypothetical protein